MAACATERPATEPEVTTATREAPPAAPKEKPQFVAIITARNSNVVTPDFEGRVKKLYVHNGQPIKAGDPIAELDTRDLIEQAAEAESGESASMAEAGASGASASESLRQAGVQERLSRFGASAPDAAKIERAKYAEAGARAGASAARAKQYRAKREDLKNKIAHATLVAPMDGVISTIKLKEGELARKGGAVARVYDSHDLVVRFAVTKEHRKELKKGMRVEFLMPGLEHPAFATVETISDELEPPISYTMVDAKLDTSKLAPDEVRVASTGHVRLADAGGKR